MHYLMIKTINPMIDYFSFEWLVGDLTILELIKKEAV